MPLSFTTFTDDQLISQYANSRFDQVKASCLHELTKRFKGGFVVYSPIRKAFVESIDVSDGGTEWTRDKAQARIFSGEGWVDVWARPELTFQKPELPCPEVQGLKLPPRPG